MRGSAVETGAVPRLRKVHVAPQLRKAQLVLHSGGNSSAVERQPSKLGVAGSNPVSRSTGSLATGRRGPTPLRGMSVIDAHVAQSVEHVLGKDGVTGSSPVMGSTITGSQRS